MEAGIEPASPGAGAVVAALTSSYACSTGRPDDDESRRRLLERLRTVADPRRERYVELLAVVNGWAAPETLVPVLAWSIRALEARRREPA